MAFINLTDIKVFKQISKNVSQSQLDQFINEATAQIFHHHLELWRRLMIQAKRHRLL